MSAPLFTKISVDFKRLLLAASKKGVYPSVPLASTLAPFSSNMETIWSFPSQAA